MSLIFGHIPLAGYGMDQSLAFEITRRSPTRVISKANGGRLGMTRQYIALIHCEISNLVLFCLPSTPKSSSDTSFGVLAVGRENCVYEPKRNVDLYHWSSAKFSSTWYDTLSVLVAKGRAQVGVAASSGDWSKRIRDMQYTDHEDYTMGS